MLHKPFFVRPFNSVSKPFISADVSSLISSLSNFNQLQYTAWKVNMEMRNPFATGRPKVL